MLPAGRAATKTAVVSTIGEVFSSYSRGGSASGGSAPVPASDGFQARRSVAAGQGRAVVDDTAPLTPHMSVAQTAAESAIDHLSAGETAALERVWHEARRDLRDKERELQELQAREFAEASLARAGALQRDALVRQLAEEKDRARFLELRLRECVGNNEQLRAQAGDSLTKLGEALKCVEEKAAVVAALSDGMAQLQTQLSEVMSQRDTALREREAVIARSLEAMSLAERQQAARAAEIAALESKIREGKEAAVAASRIQSDLNGHIATLRSQLDAAAGRAVKLGDELVAARAVIARTEANRTTHAALTRSLDQARLDAARLVRLLAHTAEYKLFVSAAFLEAASADAGRGIDGTAAEGPLHGGSHFMGAALQSSVKDMQRQHALAGADDDAANVSRMVREYPTHLLGVAIEDTAPSSHDLSSYRGTTGGTGGGGAAIGGRVGSHSGHSGSSALAGPGALTRPTGIGGVLGAHAGAHAAALGSASRNTPYALAAAGASARRGSGRKAGGSASAGASAGAGARGAGAGLGALAAHFPKASGGAAAVSAMQAQAKAREPPLPAAAEAELKRWVPKELVSATFAWLGTLRPASAAPFASAGSTSAAAGFTSEASVQLGVEDLRRLLCQLHGLWGSRMHSALKAQRAAHGAALREAHKAANFNTPYREVLQASTIARLAGQVKALQAQLQTYGVAPNASGGGTSRRSSGLGIADASTATAPGGGAGVGHHAVLGFSPADFGLSADGELLDHHDDASGAAHGYGAGSGTDGHAHTVDEDDGEGGVASSSLIGSFAVPVAGTGLLSRVQAAHSRQAAAERAAAYLPPADPSTGAWQPAPLYPGPLTFSTAARGGRGRVGSVSPPRPGGAGAGIGAGVGMGMADASATGVSTARSRAGSPSRSGQAPHGQASFTTTFSGHGASLMSVPGSGGQRLDPAEMAVLLEEALATVDFLRGRLAASEGERRALRESLAQALARRTQVAEAVVAATHAAASAAGASDVLSTIESTIARLGANASVAFEGGPSNSAGASAVSAASAATAAVAMLREVLHHASVASSTMEVSVAAPLASALAATEAALTSLTALAGAAVALRSEQPLAGSRPSAGVGIQGSTDASTSLSSSSHADAVSRMLPLVESCAASLAVVADNLRAAQRSQTEVKLRLQQIAAVPATTSAAATATIAGSALPSAARGGATETAASRSSVSQAQAQAQAPSALGPPSTARLGSTTTAQSGTGLHASTSAAPVSAPVPVLGLASSRVASTSGSVIFGASGSGSANVTAAQLETMWQQHLQRGAAPASVLLQESSISASAASPAPSTAAPAPVPHVLRSSLRGIGSVPTAPVTAPPPAPAVSAEPASASNFAFPSGSAASASPTRQAQMALADRLLSERRAAAQVQAQTQATPGGSAPAPAPASSRAPEHDVDHDDRGSSASEASLADGLAGRGPTPARQQLVVGFRDGESEDAAAVRPQLRIAGADPVAPTATVAPPAASAADTPSPSEHDRSGLAQLMSPPMLGSYSQGPDGAPATGELTELVRLLRDQRHSSHSDQGQGQGQNNDHGHASAVESSTIAAVETVPVQMHEQGHVPLPFASAQAAEHELKGPHGI